MQTANLAAPSTACAATETPCADDVPLNTITDKEVRELDPGEADRVLRMIVQRSHDKAIDAHIQDYSRRDDATGRPLDPRVDGPCYTSRSLAMVHVAMYDAFAGISRNAATYLKHSRLPNIDEGAPRALPPRRCVVRSSLLAAQRTPGVCMAPQTDDHLKQMMIMKTPRSTLSVPGLQTCAGWPSTRRWSARRRP